MKEPRIRLRVPWDIGTLSWLANRIAGTVIAVYLILHISVISRVVSGSGSFNTVMQSLNRPFWLVMEMFLVLAVIFHGVNGIRLMLIDFGLNPRLQAPLFWVVAAVSAVTFIIGFIIFIPVIIGS